MRDYYQTNDAILCPKCGREIYEWEGQEGPNALFIWLKGNKHPIDQRADEDCKLEEKDFIKWFLPEKFELWNTEGNCTVVAEGMCENGIWNEIVISNAKHT